MKNFLKKQREIVIIFIYVVIVAALIYFVILPFISKIKEVNNRIQEEGVKQDMTKQRLEELPKIRQQYDNLQKNEGLLDVFLNDDEAVVLIEKLEKLAQDSGNKIEISVQDTQAQKNPAKAKDKQAAENTLISMLPSPDYLQMQIVLTGPYNKIINFIGKIESMEYYSDIIGIKIKQSESDNNSNDNFGSVNPFKPVLVAVSDEKPVEPIEPAEKNIEAALNVVFYTKK